jgi:glutathionylspermidine amidase/synthetase
LDQSICISFKGNTTISGNTTRAPYGIITGYASINVPAYSNGNDSYTSDEWNYLYGVFMGMTWQCVEYARRWLFIRKGCVFGSIEGAADMWTELNNVQQVVDGKCFNLKKYPNGSPSPPINESLLIYNRSGVDLPFGHVAVIIDVLPDFIRVAEQNYFPYYWSGNYSRQIEYILQNGSYYIEDYYPILGWMSIDDNNQAKPLDQPTINAIIQLNGSSPNFICRNNAVRHRFSIQ